MNEMFANCWIEIAWKTCVIFDFYPVGKKDWKDLKVCTKKKIFFLTNYTLKYVERKYNKHKLFSLKDLFCKEFVHE